MIACPPHADLERFLSGILPHSDAALVETHLGSCADCSSYISEARSDDDLLPSLRRVDLPAGLRRRPERLGSYRILGELGAGGMGIVYEAEQDQPRRRVALKVMRPGLLSAKALRRFEHEAQALGRLQHPGIARILESSTLAPAAETQPFLAMELVRGLPLMEHLRQQRSDLPARIDLAIHICAALQHAHEHGVVHRDLKPSNILVESDGSPKILDFGVARLADGVDAETMHTGVGQMVGTLAYMSPEQVAGATDELGTRSDIYTLGVLIYQMLCGQLPYDMGRSAPELLREISEGRPIPLRQRDPGLDGDLNTLVATCLEKDPGRRYASAAAVAEDLRRFLAHEPLLARPPSPAYLARKFARRHRGLVASIGAIAAVLVTAVVLSLSWWRTAERAAELAEQRRQQAEDEATQAEAAREFMQEVLIQATPREGGSPDVSLGDVLDTALTRVDSLSDPLVEASIRHTLGRVYEDLGKTGKSESNLLRALQLYEERFGPDHPKVAYVRSNLAQLRLRQGRYADARKEAERVIARRDALLPGRSMMLGTAYLTAGHGAYSTGAVDEAEAFYRQAIATHRLRAQPLDREVAVAQGSLAMLLANRGHLAEAEKLYQESLATQRQLLGGSHPTLVTAMGNYANLLERQDQHQRAEQLRREALAIAEKSFRGDDARLAICMRSLGFVMFRNGKAEAGEQMMRRGIAMQERCLGAEHPRVAQSLNQLAGALRVVGRAEEALRTSQKALRLATAAFGPDHVLSLRCELGLGWSLQGVRRFAEAEPRLRACLQRAEQAVAWSPATIHEIRHAWLAAMLALGRRETALPELQKLAAADPRGSHGSWAQRQLEDKNGK